MNTSETTATSAEEDHMLQRRQYDASLSSLEQLVPLSLPSSWPNVASSVTTTALVQTTNTPAQTTPTNTIQIGNMPNEINAPLPPAQIALAYEDMENAIKASLLDPSVVSDHSAPIHSQMDMTNGRKNEDSQSKKLLGLNGNEAIDTGTRTDHQGDNPTLSSENNPCATIAASQTSNDGYENSQSQAAPAMPAISAAAAVVTIRPPPLSMQQHPTVPNENENDDEPNNEPLSSPVPMFHEVEARLVPDEPVYDAVPIENNSHDAQGTKQQQPPMWKRQLTFFISGFCIAVAVIVGVLISRGSNNDNGADNDSQESQALMLAFKPSSSPSRSTVPSGIPSVLPTNQPSQSFQPSLRPSHSTSPSDTPSSSVQPSSSQRPSAYWSSLLWTRRGQSINGEPGQGYGISVSISSDGNIMVVGASGDLNGVEGQVVVHVWNENTLKYEPLEEGSLTSESSGDLFGQAVTLSGDSKTLAIGAVYNADNGYDSGKVVIYGWDEAESHYKPKGKPIRGWAANDYLGWSLALSQDGKLLAVGAPGTFIRESNSQEDLNEQYRALTPGYAVVYRFDEITSNYEQLGQIISGETVGDWLGYNVALSSDGKTLAVAVPASKSGTHQFNDRPSRVNVYGLSDNDSGEGDLQPRWKPLGQSLTPETAEGEFAHALALSADGRTVVTGSPQMNGNGFYSGQVAVFNIEY